MPGARAYSLTTSLGETKLLFYRMIAVEALSEIPQFELQCLSEDPAIDPDSVLATAASISLELPDASSRKFVGYVTRFAQKGKHGRFHVYHMVVHPWLWFLTRTADCRIFQNLSVPDIVKEVFADHATADFDDRLTATYEVRKFCVQYRETDFAFVSRLLEEVGIYYFFIYRDGKNILVLADSLSAHEPYREFASIPFVQPQAAGRAEVDHISSWNFQREVQPGRFVVTDYDFKKPRVKLEASSLIKRSHDQSDYEIFDFPGEYYEKSDGEFYAELRRDEAHSCFEVVDGEGNVRGMANGSLFTLRGHPRGDQNKEYLLTRTEFDCQAEGYESDEIKGATFDCRFRALASSQQFRPPRRTPRPVIKGLQTAVVTGPAGEEIHTDEFGRVKVHFHWDRYGEHDENDSCWIRVSQPWAGKRWGSVSIPRIGQEVIVDFLEGDPDRPIIIGRVYNGDAMPPYALPAAGVISGIKSQTHKGSGFNEMSMDDTAGSEKITIHGQYDMNTTVEHDQTLTVHNDRSITVDGTHTETVTGDTRITIESGTFAHDVAGNTASYHVSGDLSESFDAKHDQTVGADQTLIVRAKRGTEITSDDTLQVGGNRSESVTGDRLAEVSGKESLTVNGSLSQDATGEASYKSAAKITLSVAASTIEIGPGAITLTCGPSTVKIDPTGVAITAPKISLNG